MRGKEKTEDMPTTGVRGEDPEADRGEERGAVSDILETDMAKMVPLLLLLLVLCKPMLCAQDKQPTRSQCVADRDAWHPLTMEDVKKIPFNELERRKNEMDSCRFADKINWDGYVLLSRAFEHEQYQRLRTFVQQHYWSQFMEDDQGDR